MVGVLGLGVLAFGLAGPDYGRALAQPAKGSPLNTNKFYGAATCQQCHTKPNQNTTDFVKLTEFTTWRTEDRHSLAYAVLEGPRGQQMGEILAGDKGYVLRRDAGCLNCHAMNFEGREGTQFSLKDGVSCDGCHGPSQEWIGPHFADKENWRKMTPEQKLAKGMRDLRDPTTRAELCLSCHVGNAAEGKVVTHPMYAAGHPPLPGIEVATFSKNLPQHWYDLKDVPFLKTAPEDIKKIYHYDIADVQHSRLTLESSAVVLREQMNLVAGRADLKAANPKNNWPELVLPIFKEEKGVEQLWPQVAMAHSDCYACHHELRRPSWRQERGYGIRLLDGQSVEGVPGRPQVRPWPMALFEISLRNAFKDDAPKRMGDLKGALDKLYAACNARPFGTPEAVGQAAQALQQWCRQSADVRSAFDKLDRKALPPLLGQLSRLPEAYYPDFDTARQLASAFQVLYVESSGKGEMDAKARKVLAGLMDELDLWSVSGEDPARTARSNLIKEQVEKLAGGKKLATAEDLQTALQGIPTEKLRDALLTKEFLEAYQNLRNKDYVAGSKAAADYDPASFRKKLDELHGLVPKE
jgi:hypothetical protein